MKVRPTALFTPKIEAPNRFVRYIRKAKLYEASFCVKSPVKDRRHCVSSANKLELVPPSHDERKKLIAALSPMDCATRNTRVQEIRQLLGDYACFPLTAVEFIGILGEIAEDRTQLVQQVSRLRRQAPDVDSEMIAVLLKELQKVPLAERDEIVELVESMNLLEVCSESSDDVVDVVRLLVKLPQRYRAEDVAATIRASRKDESPILMLQAVYGLCGERLDRVLACAGHFFGFPFETSGDRYRMVCDIRKLPVESLDRFVALVESFKVRGMDGDDISCFVRSLSNVPLDEWDTVRQTCAPLLECGRHVEQLKSDLDRVLREPAEKRLALIRVVLDEYEAWRLKYPKRY